MGFSDLCFHSLQCYLEVFCQLLPIVGHLLGSLSFSFSQGNGFIVLLHSVALEHNVRGKELGERDGEGRGGEGRAHLRVNVNSDVVQSVANPDTASALEQFLRRDVDLLVNPTVVLVLRNVIALLAGDSLFFLYFVTSGAAMEVHL